MANYLTYPVKVMNITQTYNGTTSHRPHWDYATPKDYPIDEACEDTGRSWFYCPCDEIEVVRVYGYKSSGVNTVWLTSTSKCDLACGSKKIISMQVTHMNDDDLGKLYVGQRFKRGEKMFREGTDGATGNHFHISVGDGKITNGGWVQNSKGKWVLSTTDGAYLPENAFWIDPSFTKIQCGGGLDWKKLGTSASTSTTPSKSSFLPDIGYFKKGDVSPNIGKIASFMRSNFPAYTSSAALGNIYGDNLINAIKEFQRKTGLVADGYTGELTLAMLKKYGFSE